MSITDNVRGFLPRGRLALVAVVALLLTAVLIAAYLIFFRAPYDVLFSRLRPADAATIVAELDRRHVPYRLQDGGATILAPHNMVDATRLNVMSADLPIRGMVGFELFNRSDMGLTDFAQRINYQRALQGELARTIMTLEDVDAARIHLSIPEASVFREDRRAPRAAVTILTRPGRQLSERTVWGIQRLVASSVPDLDVASVVVLDGEGDEISRPAGVATTAPTAPTADDPASMASAARIRNALMRAFPELPLNVTVTMPQSTAVGPAAGLQEGPRAHIAIVVTSRQPLASDLAQAVRSVALTAAGADIARGDEFDLVADSASASPPPALPPPAAREVARPVAQVQRSPLLLSAMEAGGVILALLLALALAVFAWSVWQKRGDPRPLSSSQREAYVTRLRRLLDEEADVYSAS